MAAAGWRKQQPFPKAYARTRRFALGVPSAFTAAPDGRRVAFLRTRGGRDPASCLWQLDARAGRETLLADPAVLLGVEPGAALPDELLRQLSRSPTWGITSYSTDLAVRRACFAVSGRLWVADLEEAARPGSQRIREITLAEPVSAPGWIRPALRWRTCRRVRSGSSAWWTGATGNSSPRTAPMWRSAQLSVSRR